MTTTSHRRATTADLTLGATVYTSRTGRVARTITQLEDQPNYPTAGPLVHARRVDTPAAVTAMVFALSELWVHDPR